jgi:hypothetical protein
VDQINLFTHPSQYFIYRNEEEGKKTKYPFLDRNELGCIENIEEDKSSRKRIMGNIHILASTN